MKLMTRLFGAYAIAAALMVAALPSPAQAQQGMIETIKKRGKMQVAFGTFLPWAVRDKQGQWIGFEIDVSTKLAKDMAWRSNSCRPPGMPSFRVSSPASMT